jgi:hypothetical protein
MGRNEKLLEFVYKNIKLEIYWDGWDKCPNRLYIDNKLAHEDLTFRPSPLYAYDSAENVAALLSFYCMEEGDVPEEYFKIRNAPIVDRWAESGEGDKLKLLCNDLDNEDYRKEAIEFFEKHTTIF